MKCSKRLARIKNDTKVAGVSKEDVGTKYYMKVLKRSGLPHIAGSEYG